MRNLILITLIGASSLSATAVTPLWMRDANISPDGKDIVFTYKGDIYKVPAKGGDAVQLTTQGSYESSPVWSPDGRKIAFASDRYGNADIFVMPAEGGAATRLTTNSASETPWTFSADGKYVLFSASIQDPAESAMFPSSSMSELYKVPVNGGRTEQVLATPAEMVNFDNSGKKMLYQDQKGFEDKWRKHHTSSITRDIWIYDTSTGEHVNLTNRAGEDRNPVFSPDGGTVYFLSERNGGSMNVYSMPLNAPAQAKAVTSFRDNPVRFLSVAGDGTLCYTYDGAIYTQRKGGKPELVSISIIRDDDSEIADLSFSRGATSASVSPDGKQVAFIVRGEVFVTSVEYGTTKRITETETGEADVDFASDNRSVVYAAERDGVWGIYRAKISREDDLNFPNATLIEEERLTPDDRIDRAQPKFSPDGKQLAFVENETKLMVMDLESKKIRQVTDGSNWYYDEFNYNWSPDGKWLTLEIIGNGRAPYTDVAIVKSDGSEAPFNLTNSGYFSMMPRFVLDGNAVMFLSDRYGMRSHGSWGSLNDVMLVFLNKDSYDKFRLNKEDYELLKELEKEQAKTKDDESDKKKDDKKDSKKSEDDEDDKDIVVEFDGIDDRIVRITPNSSDICDAVVSKDGEKLFYLSSVEKGYDLWKIDLREKDISLLKGLDTPWANLQLDKEGDNLFILGSTMKKMGVVGEKLENITFSAKMKFDLAKEREYMFDHVCRQEARHFFRTDMQGVDWKKVTATYRKFLPHINNNYDFATLLSEMLGELNVSHTGGRYYHSGKGDSTADLGLLFDMGYAGKGMKVAEIIEKGPFDRGTTKVAPGVVIEKINGREITENTDYYSLLNGLNGKKTLVSFFDQATGERWDEVVKPVSKGVISELLYRRWVKQREADVEKWSGGRLGYVHIESMDDGSFRTIYSEIFGKYNKCDGIVIDTRFNGGGRLHENLEMLFSGEKYLTQVFRGRPTGDMPSFRWNKPSIMLQCESNYSNAHGTPWVYRFKRMGKLVGAPVPGTMTSVSWERLQDPSLVFGTPIIGYRTAEGNYLENTQLEPDILVLNAPGTIVKGEDTQLRTAVEELLKEIDNKNK